MNLSPLCLMILSTVSNIPCRFDKSIGGGYAVSCDAGKLISAGRAGVCFLQPPACVMMDRGRFEATEKVTF